MLLFPMIYYFCTHLDKHNDHENKLYFIIVATLLCPTSLYAQSGTDKRSVLSFQTGPTLYTGKLIGIAGYSSNCATA